MKRRLNRLANAGVVVATAWLTNQSVAGQQVDQATRSAPAFPATRVEAPPVLDGDVLGDPGWARSQVIRNFTQITPDEGEPASEKTEVRVVYTKDALYVGVVCYDRSPADIIVADSRRDSPLDDTDSFQLIVDTFHDRQSGFVFGTNPAGLEYDGQVTNEGAGSGGFSGGGGGGGGRPGQGQQSGSGGGFNLNWDGSWQVRTRLTEVGWEAEFAVPFRTLRYPAGESQTWGLNFQRNIRRRKETSFWAPLPRQFNLYRLSQAGELTNLQVPPQRNLKITPYVLGQAVHRTASKDTTTLGDVGGDLKYSLTPSLTLDLTYNTDFAQVEVDEEQINLDRFNLFFPEKRPFFLENAGLFSVGQPGQTDVFFSRRIGIAPDGQQIPIVAGARLQGKVGGTSVGLLNMQTEDVKGQIAANNFSVARVRQDFRNRSHVGAMLVNRQGTGDLAIDEDWNRTYAVDGRLGLGSNGLVSGYAAGSQTPGVTADEHAYNIGTSYDTETWRFGTSFTEVTEAFNPEVGFLQRDGFRRGDVRLFTMFRPANLLGLQEIRPHVLHNTYWNFDGVQESQYTHLDSHWEWQSGHELNTGMNLTEETVFAPFEIFPGVMVPSGSYPHQEAQLVFTSDQADPVSVGLNSVIGGFFGGSRVQLRPSLNVRVGRTFTASLGWERNDVDLPQGQFVANIGRARLSYSFTTRMFAQALVQFNDSTDVWSANLRFGLLSAANTGLFIVYNDSRGLDDFVPRGAGRSLVIKYSYLMDLLR